MTDTNRSRPRVLIEDWLPVAELGIESRRERAVVSTIPPLNWLHVWWARRPLVASAAVVLGGLLPAWTAQLAAAFPTAKHVRTERDYRRWFLHLVGIWGDPVTARRMIDAANATGTKLQGNGYGYKQAYRNHVGSEDIDLLHALLRHTWGVGPLPLVSDPTAGGGSIPFVATRLGIPVHANDLNGVAAAVLRAGVEIPSERGSGLVPHLQKWGVTLVSRIEQRLKPFFPLNAGESVIAYIWANAVDCPRTGRLVPLLTDKWLRKEKGKEAAVELDIEVDGVPLTEPRFRVVTGWGVDVADAARGLIKRGSAISPYDNLVIDGDYIKAEAKAGRMKQVLYAVAIRTLAGDREFRAASPTDLQAIADAEAEFARLRPEWEANGILPTEDIDPVSNYERGHRMYGISRWTDFFTPRQALVHGTFADEFQRLVPEVRRVLGEELGSAVLTELALMQGKALNWNGRGSTWNVGSQGMRSFFEKHNFSFKWTFAEFEGATALYGWCCDRVIAAYGQIANLLDGTGLAGKNGAPLARTVRVTQGTAADVPLGSGSVTHICMDPPYYDNVMYAELADYFYVWEKRALGLVTPEYFADPMTDKDNEAVANPARFADMGRRKNELADLDYEAKMTSIFTECQRILRDDGVLSVMFTHKRAEAWDTLGMGLLRAGFTIETSWPVNTEREQSLHQAEKNSAASTIMLVCRKRDPSPDAQRVFLDDIEADIRAAAREALARFQADGIAGVDLLLSTYGPVLSIISRHWPVYSTEADTDGRARLLRPDEALHLAREEVVRLQRNRLVGRDVQVDSHTDFALIAWETFKASEFPYDDARRLALAVGGLDMDELARDKVIEKKAGTVRLLPPAERVRRGDSDLPGVRVDATSFPYALDAVHTVLYIGRHDGMAQAKAVMDRLGLTDDPAFLATVQGLINAIPRAKLKGEWVVPEAGLLDTLAAAYLPDVVIPPQPDEAAVLQQGSLFDD